MSNTKELTQKEIILISLTTILNVRINDTLNLMRNLDLRVKKGITEIYDCSFQVANAYLIYNKYISVVDPDQITNRKNQINETSN